MSAARTFHVAVVGATGAVGTEMLRVLAERDFPVGRLTLLASARSAGRALPWKGATQAVEALGPDSFHGVEIALFSAGASVSRDYAPRAAADGAVVIDNTSAFRMNPDVPLVVPEVNGASAALAFQNGRRIIANPNCSTIQMVVALAPLHRAAGIERIVVATYQSVSGKGRLAMDELLTQSADVLAGRPAEPKVFPRPIAFNLLPHIDDFTPNGYTKEEMKMVNETRKIIGDESIRISATTVRVPVLVGHSEAVNVVTRRKIALDEARALLRAAPGVQLLDDPARPGQEYPTPREAAGTDLTYVGRLREDLSHERGLDLWIVADNLRKGAATNAVQIAELCMERHL
ncbi:MAG TPA: aspartate-semialdehyde dehydrogenase [Myxococcota bacterium]|jgi:aspartate-semialdehyde dehydrogenase|nr:aspartate-semialdehyde dehydrogenase [Myxococcota bacterium]